MSKRRKETSEEKWTRLMEDYEKMFQEDPKPKRRRVIYSSSSSEDEDVPNEERLGPTDGSTETADNCAPDISCDSNDPTSTETVDTFDPELLKALGEVENEPVEYGDDLQKDIANRFQQILVCGLKTETREELTKKYLFPKNVPMSRAPSLNPEINAMLVETCRRRDKRLLGKQDQLGRALSAIGKSLTFLLKKNPDIPEIITILNDAGKLIADSHYGETDTRRSVIIPLIDKSLVETFKDRKRDDFLFGDKLGEIVNSSKGIKKTSQIIQAQASTSANTGLNTRGPSSYRTRQQRAGQNYPRRAGGPSATYPFPNANRRRYPPPPPPPPPGPPGRRYPPPPPLPPHVRRHQSQAHRSTYLRRN